MAGAALFFALTLPIAAYAQAHHHPLHYAAVIRIINGSAHLAFALVLGRSHSIPWRSICLRPRAFHVLPIMTVRAFDIVAISLAARLIPYTVIAPILATYPIALILFAWLATRNSAQPRPLTRRTVLAAFLGIGGALIAVAGQPPPPDQVGPTSFLHTAAGVAVAVLASALIGANSFTARFGIENALRDTDGRGVPDQTATLAIASYAVGVAGILSAAPMALAAQYTEPAPAWRWLAFPAVNAATITMATILWVTSTMRTTSLAPQIACYGEPIGALILLAITGLGAGTNWLTISIGLAIVVGAGLLATVTRPTRPAKSAV